MPTKLSGLRKWSYVTAVFVAAGIAPNAQAIDVFLDWTDFEVEIDDAWSAAGWTGATEGLTASDYLGFKHAVKDRMAGHFAGFTIGIFDSAPAGSYETLKFGATTGSGGLLGKAEKIDWRNPDKTTSADIYSAHFGFIGPKASYTRPEALDRIANGLVGTASHELGHNLGLQHYDAYGQDTIHAPFYGGIVGQQNDSIMATGSTGLTGTRRGEPRSFNPFELVKLEYADGLAPTLGHTEAETTDPNGTKEEAQLILGTMLPVSGKLAINIEGDITSSSDVDFYMIEAEAGDLITANTFSAFWDDPANTHLTLYDVGGAVLTGNDDISYSGSSFMTGAGHYSSDALVMNYMATYTGVYYIAVAGHDAGSYDLLVTGLSPVPEPASMVALGIGVVALLRRRRKKN